MDFELSEDQQVLKDGVERFIADRYDFESRRKRLAGLDGTDREIWSQFAEMGWLAILVPEDAGGMGWSMLEATVILEEFGRGLVTEPYLEGAVIAPRMLVGSSSPQAEDLLGAIASGEAMIVPALLEAGGRYAIESPTVEARRMGDGFVLKGKKILVAGGDRADGLLVTASLDGGPAVFYVPADASGISASSYRTLDGGWAADVAFADVEIAGDALIASGDESVALLRRVFDEAAIGVAAIEVGASEKSLVLTTEYLETRKQFGQPLAEFQALQHRMADLFIQAAMAKSAMYGALSVIEASEQQRAQAVSAARAKIDRAALEIGSICIHLHGGMGMTVEYPIGHYYRRSLVSARSFGDSEFHLDRYERYSLADA